MKRLIIPLMAAGMLAQTCLCDGAVTISSQKDALRASSPYLQLALSADQPASRRS